MPEATNETHAKTEHQRVISLQRYISNLIYLLIVFIFYDLSFQFPIPDEAQLSQNCRLYVGNHHSYPGSENVSTTLHQCCTTRDLKRLCKRFLKCAYNDFFCASLNAIVIQNRSQWLSQVFLSSVNNVLGHLCRLNDLIILWNGSRVSSTLHVFCTGPKVHGCWIMILIIA